VSIYLAGALVLYLLAQSAVAVIQQSYALRQDSEEMSNMPPRPKNAKSKKDQKLANAKEAEVVEKPRGAKKQGRKKQ
jgi:hypothetical protein